jgi:hypothetical protein
VGGKYRIYFINDNFHLLENERFWTIADNELELLLRAPQKVETFEVTFTNSPLKNKIRCKVEHKTQRVGMGPRDQKTLVFENIEGLKVSGGYLYHIKVKSSRSYCPYFEEKDSEDRRRLGVNVHIALLY